MTALLRGKDVFGFPVVDISTGEDIAEIRDLIFEPASGGIGGFTLAKRGFFGRRMKQVLRVGAIHSVGTHAVTVDSADSITDHDVAPEEAAAV
ncbi:MAG: PRC-barrel domain-containing protein, partial [Sphingopyxis sp.]